VRENSYKIVAWRSFTNWLYIDVDDDASNIQRRHYILELVTIDYSTITHINQPALRYIAAVTWSMGRAYAASWDALTTRAGVVYGPQCSPGTTTTTLPPPSITSCPIATAPCSSHGLQLAGINSSIQALFDYAEWHVQGVVRWSLSKLDQRRSKTSFLVADSAGNVFKYWQRRPGRASPPSEL